MVRGSASRSCHSHDNRAKSARITEEVRGPHPSRIAKALGIPHIAAFGNLQLVAEESFRTNDSWAWGSMDLWARVDQLSTSVAGITSWQMHGYGKKNTTIKGYERPIQKAKGWLDERRGNGKVGSTKGEETARLARRKERKPRKEEGRKKPILAAISMKYETTTMEMNSTISLPRSQSIQLLSHVLWEFNHEILSFENIRS